MRRKLLPASLDLFFKRPPKKTVTVELYEKPPRGKSTTWKRIGKSTWYKRRDSQGHKLKKRLSRVKANVSNRIIKARRIPRLLRRIDVRPGKYFDVFRDEFNRHSEQFHQRRLHYRVTPAKF